MKTIKSFQAIFLMTFLMTSLAYGQNQVDVLRYSFETPFGTARFSGVGGAFGALGADFSVLSLNPAGLGLYRRSDVHVTIGGMYRSNEADFAGNSTTDQIFRFNFQNAGVVFTRYDRSKKWRTFNFGIGFNRLANYHRDYRFSGTTEGTIAERFVINANNGDRNPFETQLALDSELLFFDDPDSGDCPCSIDAIPGDVTGKDVRFYSTGALDELVFSVAGNYKERFLIGVTLGVPFANYTQEVTYEENDVNGNIPFFNSLNYFQRFQASGAGINVKLGTIYRVNRVFRAGLAVHSPTLFSLTDNFNNSLETNITFQDGGPVSVQSADSPIGEYEYGVRTPWKVVGSGVLLFRKFGFVSFGATWLNYANAGLVVDLDANPGDAEYEASVNQAIDAQFKNAINLRAGLEYKIKRFQVRAGYAYYDSPYVTELKDLQPAMHQVSAGFGFRANQWFMDLVVIQQFREDTYTTYVLPNGFAPDTAFNNDRLLLVSTTVGYRF